MSNFYSPDPLQEKEPGHGAISQTMVMDSALSKEEFLALLDSSIIKSRKSSSAGAVHNIAGRIREDRFMLTRLAGFKNGFARDLHGTVVDTGSGCQIIYRCELNALVRTMFTCWCVVVMIPFLAGLVSIFGEEIRMELIAGPLALLAGGLLVINLGISKGRVEEETLERFLTKVAGMGVGYN
jgi:hypothetical protein